MYMNLTETKKVLENFGFSNLELVETTEGHVWGHRFEDGSVEEYEVFFNKDPWEREWYEIWTHGVAPNGDTYVSWGSYFD